MVTTETYNLIAISFLDDGWEMHNYKIISIEKVFMKYI